MPFATVDDNVPADADARTSERGIDAVAGAAIALVIVGLGLRWVQYAADVSLWLDEIALVKGIVGTDPWDLLVGPLPFDQVAPKGFLLAQKLVVAAFGSGDYALRLFPFLSACTALVVFAHLSRRILPPVGALVAILLFATCASFISFAGIVKQYSTDVLVAVVLTTLAFELTTTPTTERKAWGVAAASALLVWFAHPGAIVAAALAGPILLWLSPADAANRWRLPAIVVSSVGVSSLAVVLLSMASTTTGTQDLMQAYWADGFPPTSFARIIETAWPWPYVHTLFGAGVLVYPLSPLYPVLAGIGFMALWFQRRRTAIILIAPIVFTLLAAAARQYPFAQRLILFLVPFVLLFIGNALQLLYDVLRRVSAPVAGLTVSAVALASVTPIVTTRPPYRIEDLKSALSQIAPKRRMGDATYVYYGAAPAMSVYAPSFGYRPGDYAVGGCHLGERRRYLEELDTFRGTPRLWVVLTHTAGPYGAREDILGYLDAIGVRLDEVTVGSHAVGYTPAPAEMFLYDLSAASPGGVESTTFELASASVLDPANECTRGPQVMIPSDFQCGFAGMPCTRRLGPER